MPSASRLESLIRVGSHLGHGFDCTLNHDWENDELMGAKHPYGLTMGSAVTLAVIPNARSRMDRWANLGIDLVAANHLGD